MIGQTFGALTVITRAGLNRGVVNTHAYWICRCVCGKEVVVRSDSLRQKKTQSCGCMRGRGGNMDDITYRKWTAEQDQWLREHVLNRASSTEIALAFTKTFGLIKTRNAIIGRCHRMGLNLGAARPSSGCHGPTFAREVKNRMKNLKPTMPTFAARNPQPPPMPAEPMRAQPKLTIAPKNLTLMQLTNQTCRWPMNEGGPYLFCGLETMISSPYCVQHTRLGFTHGRR
jgi:hypothetical protein